MKCEKKKKCETSVIKELPSMKKSNFFYVKRCEKYLQTLKKWKVWKNCVTSVLKKALK